MKPIVVEHSYAIGLLMREGVLVAVKVPLSTFQALKRTRIEGWPQYPLPEDKPLHFMGAQLHLDEHRTRAELVEQSRKLRRITKRRTRR